MKKHSDMARLYSNENFPLPVVEELRRRGHDILTVLEAGRSDQAIGDHEVLAFAISLGRAVLTLNRKDFIRLHLEQANHAGILVCTFDSNFIAQAERIDAAIQLNLDLAGKLLRINRPPIE